MEYILAICVIIISLLLIYLRFYLLTYWKRRNIPHDEPEFLTGNMKGWRTTRHWVELVGQIYKNHRGKGPFAGMYFYLKPTIVAVDLDFIKNILIRDFSQFFNRGVFHNERDDPLSAHLFAIEDEKWRVLRSKLSPTFSSGKMKLMFSTVSAIAKEMVRTCEEQISKPKIGLLPGVMELEDLVGRYTADVIGTCAFGLECNSLQNPNAEFVVMGRKALSARRYPKLIDSFLIEPFPKLAKKLRLGQIHPDCEKFYLRVIRETVEYRTKNKIKRNDFMDLLLNINALHGGRSSEENAPLTLNEIAAQSFVFFVAGFDTSSTTMAYALYELAQNRKIQERARQEISEVFRRHGNEFNYEAMNEMNYLQMIIAETLRKYPVVGLLFRQANAHYNHADPKYFIEKGSSILIPIYGIHHDPDIYPDPDRFDPERFSEEEVQKRHPCAYLPFGEGPRNCIGLRFAKMQTTLGLAVLLNRFKFSVCCLTKPPVFNVQHLLLSTTDGIHLNVEKN